MKAKEILYQKVEEDITQRPNNESLLANLQSFKEERYELFLGGVLSTISLIMDGPKFEDFARTLFGQKAYLLFSFDKLITSVSYYTVE